MNAVKKEEPVIVVCTKDKNACNEYIRQMLDFNADSAGGAALLSAEECKADPSVLSNRCHVIYLASAAQGADVFQQIRSMICCG